MFFYSHFHYSWGFLCPVVLWEWADMTGWAVLHTRLWSSSVPLCLCMLFGCLCDSSLWDLFSFSLICETILCLYLSLPSTLPFLCLVVSSTIASPGIFHSNIHLTQKRKGRKGRKGEERRGGRKEEGLRGLGFDTARQEKRTEPLVFGALYSFLGEAPCPPKQAGAGHGAPSHYY